MKVPWGHRKANKHFPSQGKQDLKCVMKDVEELYQMEKHLFVGRKGSSSIPCRRKAQNSIMNVKMITENSEEHNEARVQNVLHVWNGKTWGRKAVYFIKYTPSVYHISTTVLNTDNIKYYQGMVLPLKSQDKM